jgi:predicted DNA-binding transcriptional regulator AlpA
MSAVAETTTRRLIDVKQVGHLYGMNWRTVYRFADLGLIPAGLKLGALRRWDESEVLAHIAAGCPPVKARGAR